MILGLLADAPMTGYDIKKRVQASLSVATHASYGTLYPTLHKLLDEGAVAVQEVEQVNRPSKKVYRLTDVGRRQLRAWLHEPAAADQVRREFLLKLYLAKHLAPEIIRDLIHQRRSEQNARIKALKAEAAHGGPVTAEAAFERDWVLDYAIVIAQAEIDWLDQLEAKIGAVRAKDGVA